MEQSASRLSWGEIRYAIGGAHWIADSVAMGAVPDPDRTHSAPVIISAILLLVENRLHQLGRTETVTLRLIRAIPVRPLVGQWARTWRGRRDVARGGLCTTSTPSPADYLRLPLPVRRGRPDEWVCRRCTEWWDWHPYRPPTEQELDLPCVECGKAMEPEERAVEVNRHLLARLSTGSVLPVLPVPTVAPVPGHQQRKASSGLLSKKEAARRLGVDRATTLAQIILTGRIKTVDVNGHQRIPVSEIERILSEGVPATEPQPSRSRRAPRIATSRPSESPADAIRKLKF